MLSPQQSHTKTATRKTCSSHDFGNVILSQNVTQWKTTQTYNTTTYKSQIQFIVAMGNENLV